LVASQAWSLVYIDGNHDYEVARQDWELCSRHLEPDGVIVLDDAGLTTNYRPPRFATGGHPGPSRLAREIDRTRFKEILQVGHNRVYQKIS
jgi:predicted O-methyltransferase YrrM